MSNVNWTQVFTPGEATRGQFVPIDFSTLFPAYSGRGRYAVITYEVGAGSPGEAPLSVNVVSGVTLAVSGVNIDEPVTIDLIQTPISAILLGQSDVIRVNVVSGITLAISGVNIDEPVTIDTIQTVVSSYITNGSGNPVPVTLLGATLSADVSVINTVSTVGSVQSIASPISAILYEPIDVVVTNHNQLSAYITNPVLAVSGVNIDIDEPVTIDTVQTPVTAILHEPIDVVVTNHDQISAYITNPVINVSGVNIDIDEPVTVDTIQTVVSTFETAPVTQVSSVIVGQPVQTRVHIPDTMVVPQVSTIATGALWNVTFAVTPMVIEIVNYGDTAKPNESRTAFVLLSSFASLTDPTNFGLPLLGTHSNPGFYSIEHSATSVFIEVSNTAQIRVFAHYHS